MRILAVDWSGRVAGEKRAIWIAEAEPVTGRVIRLESGRARDGVADHLIEITRADRELVVGFDFSFSLPHWFLVERGFSTADDLWAAASIDGERWLTACDPPFWGRPGRTRPPLPDHFRVTETELPATAGVRPKSTFQVGGAGSVGTGSIRGFPMLARLRAAGFRIWPFHDDPRLPVAIEIYPRLFTGAVVKSRAATRAAYLHEYLPDLDDEARFDATTSEDAFDAVVSAAAMARHATALASLPTMTDATTRIEGRVWQPPR